MPSNQPRNSRTTGALVMTFFVFALLLLGTAANAAVVIVDDFSGTILGTRTVNLLPAAGTSTTPQGTFSQSGGRATMTMTGNGNGVGGVDFVYDFANTDLTSGGTNGQFYLEFISINRAGGNPGDTALNITVAATDSSNTRGVYNTGISSVAPYNMVFNFNCSGGGVCFSPNPNWTAIKKVEVSMTFPQNYTNQTTTLVLDVIRATPLGGSSPYPPVPNINANADPDCAAPIGFTVEFKNGGNPTNVTGFAAGDVVISGTAPGTKTATVSGSGYSYAVTVSGMTGTGTVAIQIPAGAAVDDWGQNSQASATESTTFGTSPAFTSAPTSTFVAGTSSSFTLTASGPPGPTFTITSGTLPTGLSFTSPTISGSAGTGTGGTHTLQFTATNGCGSATQTHTLTVNVPPTVTSANTATFAVGAAGSFTVTKSGYPTPTLSMTGSLPSGVTFTPATGVLAGTPAAGTGGAWALTFTASNGVSPNGTQSFTLNVNQPPAITSANAATLTVGSAGSFTVTKTGFPAPTLSVTGALPSGVTFTPATGALAGTPAAGTGGTYPLTFTATNGVGSPATQSFTLTINQAPAIISANATTFTVGSAGSFTVTKTGFPAPTLSVTGALPSGVTFTPATGALAGTPAAGTGGTYPLTFTASNGVGTNATQSFTLTVNQAPAITSANATAFTVGTAGSFTVTASGFPAPTLSVTGALPSGVTFTPATGILSGTPGSGGLFPLTFTASNGIGTDATQSFTLTVQGSDLAVTKSHTGAVAQGQLGVTYTIGVANVGSWLTDGSVVTVADTLPPDLLLRDISGSGWTCSTSPVQCTRSDVLANGSSYPDITVTVDVAPYAAASLVNTATVSGGNDTNASNNTATDPTTVAPGTHFCSTLDGAQEVPPTASTASGTGNVVLSPDETTLSLFVSWSGLTAPAGAIHVHGPAAPGAVAPLLFDFPVVAATLAGSAQPTAFPLTAEQLGWLKDGRLYLEIHDASFPDGEIRGQILWCGADLTVTKSHVGYLVGGQPGSYTVTVGNNGSGPTAGTVTMDDTLPADLSATAISGTGWGCTLSPLQCLRADALGSLASFPPITITVVPSLTSAVSVTNTAAVSGGGDVYATNSSASDPTTVNQLPVITSGTSTTFIVGVSGSFHVTATGQPTPTLSASGALPAGVTFDPATGLLAGTPAAGTAGTYPLLLTATNGVGSPATQAFTLTVDQVAAITSANAVTFTVGAAGSFTVTTTGSPTPGLTLAGTLPAGVSFTDNGNGTATLSGTAAALSGGVYPLSFTATNGVLSPATQSFTLTVNEAPAITSATATTFVTGAAGSFTVTTTGWPRPALTSTGALPTGITFTDNGNGTATLAGTAGATTGNTYPLALSASNGVGTAAGQSFTLTVRQAPLLTSAAATTFSVGVTGSFTVTTTAYPTAAIAMAGALPTGVTFHDNGDGTATLSGEPVAGTPGAYPLSFTATNATTPDGTQAFTLTVAKAPVLMSLRSSTNPSALGQPVAFTSGVTFTVRGIGTPSGTVQFTTDGAPLGGPVTLAAGSASSPSIDTLLLGNHAVTASYSGDATFAARTVVLTGGQTVNAFGTPTHLTYLQQPLDTEVWAQMSPAVTVELRDVADNVVTTPGISLTVALSSGTGVLSGTLTRSSDATGHVSFDDLVLESAGVKRLVITGADLTPASSSSFTVTQHAAPESLSLDRHNLGPATGNLNGVLDPGETVLLEPGWANQGAVPYLVAGTLGNLVGPGSATLVDDSADYGSIAAGSSADPYHATGNTYAVEVAVPPTRPATHWDLTVDETLSVGATTTWTLHVGGSFTDVPVGYGGASFYAQVETLLHTGVTLGCTTTTYCPTANVSRAQLAMFIARAMLGSDAAVPVTGTVGAAPYDCSPTGASLFLDVAPDSQYCRHVHYLAAQGVATGCDATHFCPSTQASRATMAEFVARAVAGGDANVPLDYLDPTTHRGYNCDPAAASLHFADVTTADSFCRHAHYLWSIDVISGCTVSTFCPANLLTRVQMAKFLVNGFGLTLYGP